MERAGWQSRQARLRAPGRTGAENGWIREGESELHGHPRRRRGDRTPAEVAQERRSPVVCRPHRSRGPPAAPDPPEFLPEDPALAVRMTRHGLAETAVALRAMPSRTARAMIPSDGSPAWPVRQPAARTVRQLSRASMAREAGARVERFEIQRLPPSAFQKARQGPSTEVTCHASSRPASHGTTTGSPPGAANCDGTVHGRGSSTTRRSGTSSP